MEDVEVIPSHDGEVRIKNLFTVLWHTNAYSWNGQDLKGLSHCILGYGAAGIVESVCEGISSITKNDIHSLETNYSHFQGKIY